jgi:mitochondrial fission protein ELM1
MRLKRQRQAFADLADERGKSAIVILGGNSKSHTFTEAAADRLGSPAARACRKRLAPADHGVPAHA